MKLPGLRLSSALLQVLRSKFNMELQKMMARFTSGTTAALLPAAGQFSSDRQVVRSFALCAEYVLHWQGAVVLPRCKLHYPRQKSGAACGKPLGLDMEVEGCLTALDNTDLLKTIAPPQGRGSQCSHSRAKPRLKADPALGEQQRSVGADKAHMSSLRSFT